MHKALPADLAHTTPRAVTNAPPSSKTLPPQVAEVDFTYFFYVTSVFHSINV